MNADTIFWQKNHDLDLLFITYDYRKTPAKFKFDMTFLTFLFFYDSYPLTIICKQTFIEQKFI